LAEKQKLNERKAARIQRKYKKLSINDFQFCLLCFLDFLSEVNAKYIFFLVVLGFKYKASPLISLDYDSLHFLPQLG
jgi:hypothetical protein